jgi:hypothetical protein
MHIKSSILDNNKFKEYRILINSVTSKDDVEYIYNLYHKQIKDPYIKHLMNSYKDSFHNNYSIGTKEFMDILNKFNKFQYRDDARDLIRKIFKRTINETQRNTIIRIIGSLPPKTITVPKLSGKKVHKKCPHCQKQTELNIDSTYVICGYTDKGFDLDGCGKDWCFRCEKKLCKSWYVHELFIHDNRYHNDKCCKLMAYKKNESRKKYCRCKKIYINHRF